MLLIYLYPANKMENLLLLLNKISEISPLGVFNQDVIVVQNAGMQHWLNLALANERGISMNIRYALPAQFLWKLMRSLASEEKVPDQSPYSREVLAWRIYHLLGLETVIKDDDFMPATRYWLADVDHIAEQQNVDKQAALKRYQLARQMADLYEQYLIFRPQWLSAWQQGDFSPTSPFALALNNENQSSEQQHNPLQEHKWQGRLWQLLTQELPYDPVALMRDAIANMADKKSIIPKRISFFGLNTMAPMWLDFINALSEHVEVHFFHLNPCFSYWGDIQSEKQALAKLSHWSADAENEQCFIGNPLLANLGQQGREFLSMIQGYSTVDIELFEEAHAITHAVEPTTGSPSLNILQQLQNDILTLSDARENSANSIGNSTEGNNNLNTHDNSIVISSAHSALREVQGLHDYLLHQFNEDPSLTPKDILVMCPQIEQYAPYVNAVFTRGWQDVGDDVPPLPCSIADRSAKDSDPLVAAFTELLALPDSRFGVSQLLSFIRLPAISHKFSISADDLDKITLWLDDASVHWGLDTRHKQQFIGEQASNSFTWQQGLSRLLRGFAFNDSEQVYQQQLLLTHVEGDDAILLGQLMLFIEQLQHFSLQLNTPRSAVQWQSFLLEQLETLFSRVDDKSLNSEASIAIIEQAIAGLVEHCQHAYFEEALPLTIIVDYLNNHFSEGDASKQFMVGQVTFCSMLPMRSIPFKVIAVLGLNDGEFPRQRQPLGFDLMSLTPVALGDRSRRGDDRYLFLEAIISARKALYLSFQGRNIKNNNERQPSIVLKELMDYLTQGYGYQFSDHDKRDLNQLPMQAFSLDNYRSNINPWPSFDSRWLALGLNEQQSSLAIEQSKAQLLSSIEAQDLNNHLVLSTEQLIRFFQHPARLFAQQNLNLYFDNDSVMLNDVEPFEFDRLQSYLVRQALLEGCLSTQETTRADNTAAVLQHAQLTGKFPDLPTTPGVLDEYVQDTLIFSEEIRNHGVDNPELIDVSLPLALLSPLTIELTLNTKLPIKNNKLVHYRSSTAKAKDLFTLYLNQLILQVVQEQSVGINEALLAVDENLGIYFNTKTQSVEKYQVSAIESPVAKLKQLVSFFIQGQQQPLLLNGELAAAVYAKKWGKVEEFTQERFESFWHGDINMRGFAEDPYINYFWPTCPEYSQYERDLVAVYDDIYNVVEKVKSTTKKASAKGTKS
ncbi:exodeoxyribonuclease V subunit gamma [Colwellia asteriadis]|uniref:exodeoxyribonuclease V subunit gamma n=1 Tax=Colwellia asteriadis TaxID=517723 RepID=UPI0031CEDB42